MKFLKLSLLIYFFLLLTNLFSQVDSSILVLSKKDSLFNTTNNGKDMIDVLGIKRFGDNVSSNRNGKPIITVVPFVGYTLQTRLAGIIAGNVAFYQGKDQETNQSVISISLSYSQNNQIIFPIISNLWSRKNKFNFLGNWRYYKFPEQTFGLGGKKSDSDRTKLDYSYFIFKESVMHRFKNSFYYAGLGYNLSYHLNIKEIKNANVLISDFEKYGYKKNSVSSGISIITLFDNRGNTINPPKGLYLNITYSPFLKVFGSDNNWQSVVLDFRKYFKLGNSENVLAFWNYNWFTFNGKAPYLDLPSTGWDTYSNVGRGYIQSRLRGENLVYMEAEFRFKISNNGMFGGILFGNAQSVSNWPDNTFTDIYPAIGAGLRIKLNKNSGTNLSIDYGIGIKGSKGLFINLGEVF